MKPAVFDRLLLTYMERAKAGAWSAPLGTLSLAWLCWEAAGATNTLIWLALVSVPDIATYLHAGAFLRRQPDVGSGRPWLYRQAGLHALAGLMWGTATWLLRDPASTDSVLSLPLAWLIGATALGASSVAEFRRSALLYMVMIWAPTIAIFVQRGTMRDWQAIGGIAALCVLSLQYAEAIRRQSIAAIENALQFEAASHELQQAKSALAHANQALEDRNAELQLAVQRISDLASTDALTGLANRREGLLRLQEAFALGERHGQPASLLFCDLDHFKRINDTHGHAVGDQVLVTLAERLRQSLRATDLPIRWGGEEFLVLLRASDADAALLVAERLRSTVAAQPIAVGELTLPVTVSVGIAARRDGEQVQAWTDRADAACYSAKAAGRNRIHVG